jgi:superfamily II DNA or RNA helicase
LSVTSTLAAPDALRDWQRTALTAWRAAGSRGIVEAVTGTGKTRVGIEALRDALSAGRGCLVLVPTTALLQQWARILTRDLPEVRIGLLGDGRVASLAACDVLIATIQSASRRRPEPADGRGLLVADECHRYGAPSFAEALVDGFDQRLGLTATLERPDGGVADTLEPYFGPVVHHYGFREALADEVIAPFRIALLGVDLTPPERDAYEENRETAKAARTQLVNRYGLPAQPFGEFLLAVNAASRGGFTSPLTRTARRYLGAFHAYREVLATTPRKLDAVPQLSPAIERARGTLLFGESVHAVERSAADLRRVGISVEALHGQVPTRQRQEALADFAAGTLQALTAPRVLDEGVDVPEADLAVIVAASQSRRQMVQRLGRVVRLKDDGRLARLIIMYVRGTTEDPATGGHEAFLDLVLEIAEDHRCFSSDEFPALLAYLDAPAAADLELGVGPSLGTDAVLGPHEQGDEPAEEGWWSTWSTNLPELGLSLEVDTTPDPEPGTDPPADLDDTASWWQDASAGTFRALQPASRDRSIPRWLEVRVDRRATDLEVERVARRFRRRVRDLDLAEAERFAQLPIVQHLAAHPQAVADALLDLEAPRIEEELRHGGASVANGTVRIRVPNEPHVLSEPYTTDLWH